MPTIIALLVLVIFTVAIIQRDVSFEQVFKEQNYMYAPTSSEEEFVSNSVLTYMCAEVANDSFIDLYDYYIEGIKSHTVPGWNIVESKTVSDTGFSAKLWVKEGSPNTYCLVFGGTDEWIDTTSYLSMETSEEPVKQVKNAVDFTNDVLYKISSRQISGDKFGVLKNLYITGHSLGGYLAYYIASEIVDSFVDGVDYNIKRENLGLEFDFQKFRCITYGAPGMYILKDLGTDIGLGNVIKPRAEWAKRKLAGNNDHKYDKYILNYRISIDDVAYLRILSWKIVDKYVSHIGSIIDIDMEKPSTKEKRAFKKTVNKYMKKSIRTAVKRLYGHMIWNYYHLASDDTEFKNFMA